MNHTFRPFSVDLYRDDFCEILGPPVWFLNVGVSCFLQATGKPLQAFDDRRTLGHNRSERPWTRAENERSSRITCTKFMIFKSHATLTANSLCESGAD